MPALLIIQIIAIALPLLLELIKFVEDAVNRSEITAAGAQKKDQVVTMFAQGWQQLVAADPSNKMFKYPIDQIVTTISPWIDQIVSVLNALGIFKKSGAASAPATPPA